MKILIRVISGTFEPTGTHFANLMSESGGNAGNTHEKDCVVLVIAGQTPIGLKAVSCSEKHHVICKLTLVSGTFNMPYVMQL